MNWILIGLFIFLGFILLVATYYTIKDCYYEGKMPKDKVYIRHIQRMNNNDASVRLSNDVLVYDSYKICKLWYRDMAGNDACLECPDSIFEHFETMIQYSNDFPKMRQTDDYLNIEAYIPTDDLKLLIMKECNKRIEKLEKEVPHVHK